MCVRSDTWGAVLERRWGPANHQESRNLNMLSGVHPHPPQCWLLMLAYVLVWAQVGQEQCWVVIAGTLGELRRLQDCTLVNTNSHERF